MVGTDVRSGPMKFMAKIIHSDGIVHCRLAFKDHWCRSNYIHLHRRYEICQSYVRIRMVVYSDDDVPLNWISYEEIVLRMLSKLQFSARLIKSLTPNTDEDQL